MALDVAPRRQELPLSMRLRPIAPWLAGPIVENKGKIHYAVSIPSSTQMYRQGRRKADEVRNPCILAFCQALPWPDDKEYIEGFVGKSDQTGHLVVISRSLARR